jgi:GTP cyclohydrolase I
MKTDKELGKRVFEHLKILGLETPVTNLVYVNDDTKIEQIVPLFKQIMEVLGLDLSDDSLAETPQRIAKMYVKEIFSGLNYDNFPKLTVIENKMSCRDEYILEKNIKFNSTCEHHFLPILGINGGCHVAYIPDKFVVGLSKINRVVKFFAKNPAVQERTTHQILVTLQFLLETTDVAVVIDAVHTCVATRGVEDGTSSTSTAAIGGVFKTDKQIRAEFFNNCK